MLDLDLLGTFVEVYRARSITAAAHALGLSQPSVSERVGRLEAQLGRTLFTRSARGAIPTADGDRLATAVTEPVERLRAAVSAPTPATGVVRIGGPSDLVAARLVPALAGAASTGLRVRFTLGLAGELLDALAAGRLDVVVSSVRPTGRGIVSRPLIDEEFVLVGAPSLRLDAARLAADPAAALAHLPLVAYDEELSIVRRYWRGQFGRRPSNPVGMVVGDLRGVLAGVVAGAGISVLPRYLADAALAQGSIVELHRPDEPPLNTLFLALPAQAASPATAAVVDLLTQRARTWDAL